MLERTTAIRFHRSMTSGKTRPCLLTCQAPGSDEIEVVAKFSAGCERGVGGLSAEAIAAMLAADLDLPVPRPLLVGFDAGFADLVSAVDPEVAERMRRSASVAFGSTKLPAGFGALPTGKAIPASLRGVAAEILAFDAIILNPDRRPENPNVLLDGRDFAILDHELAFLHEGIIGWRPPWERGSLEWMVRQRGHVFFGDLKGRSVDLARLRGAWHAITEDRLCEYRRALPTEWNQDDGSAERAVDYLREVRANIDGAIEEVVRILQ